MVTNKEIQDNLKAYSAETRELIASLKSDFQKLKSELTELVNSKNEVISQLQNENLSLRQELSALKSNVEEANAYSRRDCAIVSGSALPECVVGEDTSKVVVNLLKDKLKLPVSEADICTAHRLGPKPPGSGPDVRKVIIKFVRRDLKRSMMSAAKKNKNSGIYLNDCLTPAMRSLFYSVRKMKRGSTVIKGCSTFDGKVYVYTAGTSEGSRDIRHHIDSRATLSDFCRIYLKKALDSFLENWQK